ncbi:alpha/beta-hydrolase, partial [Microthyrium microscopicum]
FVWARGSTELPPMGYFVGDSLKSYVDKAIPGIVTFPVYYAASITTNIAIARTDDASIKIGRETFEKAWAACKGRTIIAGGYSQGAAVMTNVIPKLPAEMKEKIAAVALFGSTMNYQTSGHVPNFPKEKSRTWCNATDGVCGGSLLVNLGHLSYSNSQISEAATWMAGLVKAA